MSAPPRPRDVLVVGAGLAATQTVAALRERGFDGRVTVLGAEGVPPYDRPPLSKHLLDRPEPTWLAAEVGSDLLGLADEVHLDDPATGLRIDGHGADVLTTRGTRRADAVVLASGATARRPPGWDAATLHTVRDAESLRARLGPGRTLVVVGAGWIGAEVAGVAAAAGTDVTVVEARATPLEGALGPLVGRHTAAWYRAAGVDLRTGATVTAVQPDRVALADGSVLEADVVLVAVGAAPATAWLADALPRTADGSLRVDEGYAVLGAPRHVRAVGDVVQRRSARHGWVPGGHWDGALRGPSVLVDDLLGLDGPPLDLAPYVFSTQLGHDLTLFGLPDEDAGVLLRGDPAGDEGWTALWRRGDRVTAVLTVDRPRDVGAARKAFAGAGLPRLDAAAATDEDAPLRGVLHAAD